MKIQAILGVLSDFCVNGESNYKLSIGIFLDEELIGEVILPKEKVEEFKRRLEAGNEED